MSDHGHSFDLDDQPWNQVTAGLREKVCQSGKRRFRLLEFSAEFRELDWCYADHLGYVLSGEIVVNVDGEPVTFRQGDAIELLGGVRHRHVATVSTAVLFLVEDSLSQR